jgi:hypothetical protein
MRAALEVLRVRERLSARQLRHVVLNPLALFLEIVWIVAACFHLDVETHDLLQCRAGPSELLGQTINLAVELVAHDQSCLGIEHGQAAAHVVERDLKAAVQFLELFLLLENEIGIGLKCRDYE